MLHSDILYDSVGATLDMLWCSTWRNAAVFCQFSVILDMRPHCRWVFIVFSHPLCKDCLHACHRITPYFLNHETCQIIVNWNSLEWNHDLFPNIPSPNFRLPGGSLGYWTACNRGKCYCTFLYCDWLIVAYWWSILCFENTYTFSLFIRTVHVKCYEYDTTLVFAWSMIYDIW